MDYGKLLKRSAEMTWRNKLLWALGILIAIFTGGGGSPGSGLQYTTNSEEMERFWRSMPFAEWPSGRMPFSWEQFAAIGLGVILVLFVLMIIVAIVGAVVRYTCEGALIVAVDELDDEQRPTFRQVISSGWRRFLRLLAQDLIIGLVTFLVILVGTLLYAIVAGLLLAPGIVMITSEGAGVGLGIAWVVLFGLIFGLILVALLIAVSAVVSAVLAYAQRASMLKLEGIADAMSSAVKLFRANWKQSIGVWFWSGLVSLAVGIVLVPAVVLTAVIIAAVGGGMYAIGRSVALTAIVAVPLVAVLGLAVVWVSGLLAAFQSAVWTLAYKELVAEPALAAPEQD